MKKKITYYLIITLSLSLLSFIMFFIHYKVFGRIQDTLYYAFMDLCFIPISVLSVTIVFDSILKRRAKLEKLSKLHMLIGIFFSEIGFELLNLIALSDNESKHLITDIDDYKNNIQILKKHPHKIQPMTLDYERIGYILTANRSLFVSLMANESLLEHETFTDLLMDTIHLRDEFIFRKDKEFTHEDFVHIDSDIKRVYHMLSVQFLNYLLSLKVSYPNLYNSSKRNNPFL